MNIEELRSHCLKKNGVEESFPFGDDTLVFKVGGKLFLLTGIDSNPLKFNVKCEPDKALELREKYACVEPGYHMNKTHWNTITWDGLASKTNILEWIDNSYDLVLRSLPKKIKDDLLRTRK